MRGLSTRYKHFSKILSGQPSALSIFLSDFRALGSQTAKQKRKKKKSAVNDNKLSSTALLFLLMC
ncbi:hypothetical protein KKH38_00700 [Patescibacteria group bacterium]|nr:hypothetical protein [Patescibacteria group bacterium]MBU4600979.1 hypothetical protein [Patescibacteria group bacterium]MCG2697609.1 hypothetical protein [Candidatus Parcubacteria bacterium]